MRRWVVWALLVWSCGRTELVSYIAPGEPGTPTLVISTEPGAFSASVPAVTAIVTARDAFGVRGVGTVQLSAVRGQVPASVALRRTGDLEARWECANCRDGDTLTARWVDASTGEPQNVEASRTLSFVDVPQKLVVLTDTSWKTQDAQPPAGWLLPGFDDSAWPAAFVLSAHENEFLPGGMWNGPSIYAGSKVAWFRRSFQVSGELIDTQLFAQCNDDMTVWLNGEVLIDEADRGVTQRRLQGLTQLVVGENVLAAVCRDVIPPEHAIHMGLWGTYR